MEKTWRDLAHGPFIIVSSSVDKNPCGLAITVPMNSRTGGVQVFMLGSAEII